MHVLDIIEMVAATSSKNEKEAILKEHADNENLKNCFYLAGAPTEQFQLKAIPSGWGVCDDVKEDEGYLEVVFSVLKSLANREVTGNNAKDVVYNTLDTIDKKSAELMCRIIKKDLRCGVGDATVNKVWKGLIVKPPRQGAKSMNDASLKAVAKSTNLFIELKSDGSYAAFNGLSLMSRNGNPLSIPCLEEHLTCGKFPEVALEGELVYSLDKATREEGNGIITKVVKGTASEEEMEGAIYQIWDAIPLTDYKPKGKCKFTNEQRRAALETRYKHYLKWCEDNNTTPKVQLIPRSPVSSVDDAYKVFEGYVKDGFEGAILKDGNAGWADNGKPSSCVKMKRKDNADLEVVGIYEGEGKAAGMLGGIEMQSSCGMILVNTGSGFSDEQRKYYWENPNEILGKIVETEYDSITKDKKKDTHSLFLPIFKKVRDDKREADSMEEIKAKVRIKVKK